MPPKVVTVSYHTQTHGKLITIIFATLKKVEIMVASLIWHSKIKCNQLSFNVGTFTYNGFWTWWCIIVHQCIIFFHVATDSCRWSKTSINNITHLKIKIEFDRDIYKEHYFLQNYHYKAWVVSAPLQECFQSCKGIMW